MVYGMGSLRPAITNRAQAKFTADHTLKRPPDLRYRRHGSWRRSAMRRAGRKASRTATGRLLDAIFLGTDLFVFDEDNMPLLNPRYQKLI
jgi:hypothetical protein